MNGVRQMKKLSIALLSALMLAGCANDPYKIDPVATANAQWTVGDRVVVYSNCPSIIANSDICYGVFLGVTTKGNALLQDHYDTDEKLTDPYEYPFDIDLIKNPNSKKFNSYHPEGSWIRYYKNGQKMDEVNYTNGQINGLSRQWHENGQLAIEWERHNGKSHEVVRSWYPNGKKLSESPYVDDRRQGLSREWHSNGQKRYEGQYQNGKQIGISRRWDENGNLVNETDYGMLEK